VLYFIFFALLFFLRHDVHHPTFKLVMEGGAIFNVLTSFHLLRPWFSLPRSPSHPTESLNSLLLRDLW
jgi:hypothetical protein